MAPLRTTQDFPVRLHHRLQDLQPGRDAHKPWNASRTPLTTPSTGSGTWIVTGRELGGWPDVFRLSCFAMGGSLLF